MIVLETRGSHLLLSESCRVLGVNRGMVYSRLRLRSETKKTSRKQTVQPRALSLEEKQAALKILNSDEYADKAPAQIYHLLLEKKIYIFSISTMHRLLKNKGLNGERRAQRTSQSHLIPRLKATRVNEVWTWDIAKLATQIKGVYLSLYVVMDLYSHYIVAWMISKKENTALAQQLMREAYDRYQITESLTIHQDRGAPMTAHAYLDLLSDLSITPSHSRPRVSNDNPHSESQFKTMKYQPNYP